MSLAMVNRPTENIALRTMKPRPRPTVGRVADMLIVARATDDRYGQQLFGLLLDRLLGLAPQEP